MNEGRREAGLRSISAGALVCGGVALGSAGILTHFSNRRGERLFIEAMLRQKLVSVIRLLLDLRAECAQFLRRQ